MIVRGTTLVSGSASGPVVAIPPLSFWGGYDPATGLVIDRSHPSLGASFAGLIVAMHSGRGSSSSSSVLAEAIRRGTAPAALVLTERDSILATGAMVAEELYGRAMPIAVIGRADHGRLALAAFAEVRATEAGAEVAISERERG